MNKEISKKFDSEYREIKSGFLKLIHNRLGINIHSHQEKNLHNTIINGCVNFDLKPQEYLEKLMSCEEHSYYLEYLVSGITIGETYFFRDQKQMEHLQQSILPKLIQYKNEKNERTLRIWSAGCASGEEIYTIAMMLVELLPDINEWNLSLLGTDINTHSLKKAIKGTYTEWSMRSIDCYYKTQYFNQENNQYRLSNEIMKLVNFDYLNLNDNTYPSIFNGTNSQDLILCRNVLIYFDRDLVKKIMENLTRCLSANGQLLLGASDPIIPATKNVSKNLAITNKTSFNVALHSTKLIPKKNINEIKNSKVQIPSVNMKDTLMELVVNSKWDEALNVIKQCEINEKSSAFLVGIKATALANVGKLHEALLLCQESLQSYPTEKSLYFTCALILIELNQLQEAEMILRKTLFLDRKFVPAHFQLGLLLLRNKQPESGIKCLKNALNIALTKTSSDRVPDTQGLTYARLIEILKQEIILYSTLGKTGYINENV